MNDFKTSNKCNIHITVNQISIEPRTEITCKLKCNLRDIDAILSATEIEKVRLPNAMAKIDKNV